MNERDEALLRYLIASMGKERKGLVLIDISTTQFVRVNLIVLKGLLQAEGAKGIFITIDRPHQYMEHLLRMHRIDSTNLNFIDAIGRFSADRKEGTAPAGYLDTPFHIDTLPSTLVAFQGKGEQKVSLNDCSFAMIDNLAALLPYNSYSAVETFLRNFVDVTMAQGRMVVPLVMDKERSGPLYETARSLATMVVSARPEDIPAEAGGLGRNGNACTSDQTSTNNGGTSTW